MQNPVPDPIEVIPHHGVASASGPGSSQVSVTKANLWRWARGIGLALLTLAWALAAHMTSANKDASGWGATLALVPMGVALSLALWRLPVRWLSVLAGGAVLAALVWGWPFLKARVALLYYVEHLGIYILMSVIFGRSLYGPQESLVTQLARRVHRGHLTAAQQIYTRRVTLAWCLFFAGMAVVSTWLFWWAPVMIWSTFANLLGGPLIATMFIAEYFWRSIALPGEPRATMADAVRAWQSHRQR